MQLPAFFTSILPGDVIHDFPVISLIVANLVTIVLAIIGNWDLATVLFIYWSQSIIIGIFTVISILGADPAVLTVDLKKPIHEQDVPEGDFDLEKFIHEWGGTGDISPRRIWSYKCSHAGLFTLFFGFLHWGLFVFIVESGMFGPVNFADPRIWLSCGLFFASHLCSHIRYRHEGAQGAGFIKEEFLSTLQRIIPMHSTIFLGSFIIFALQAFGIESTMPVLVLFLVLKTRSDIISHKIKHASEEHPDLAVQHL